MFPLLLLRRCPQGRLHRRKAQYFARLGRGGRFGAQFTNDAHGPVDQAHFLRSLGLANRAAVLKAHAPPDKARDIDLAVQRLTGEGRTGMGHLFKVAAFADPKIGPLPGF